MALAIDISSYQGRPPAEWFGAVKQAGFTLAISQAWGGGPHGNGENPDCTYQLESFRSQGLDTAIYFIVPPDDEIETNSLVEAALDAAGDELQYCKFIAPDIEGSHPIHPSDPAGRLQNAIDNAKSQTQKLLGEPMPVMIYTSESGWATCMPGVSDQFSTHPLWEARYLYNPGKGPDEPPALNWKFSSFGGWTERTMLQYAASVPLDGVAPDWNVYEAAQPA